MSADKQRTYGAIRTILITYGVAAGSYLFTQSFPEGVAPLQFGMFSSRSLVMLGVVIQALMIGAHALIRRYAPDSAATVQGALILELLGDGVTVLLFALGTFGAILHMADI